MVNNCIPLILTNQYGNRYLGIWDKVDDIYDNNKEKENPDYYRDIICLLAKYHDNKNLFEKYGEFIASNLIINEENIGHEPSIIDALYKWRVHKQIYKFPKELEELLYEQDDGLDTPIWILKSLPYDSIYIETNCLDENILGFFVYKDYKAFSFVIIYDDMHYEHGGFNFDESTNVGTTLYDALVEQSNRDGLGSLGVEMAMMTDTWRFMPKILQLVLYICAENKEIEENALQKNITKKPKGKKYIKDKYREVQIWDCGNKISEKIRTFLVSNNKRNLSNLGVGDGKTKAPHSRKGHWHHFWTGKRNSEERKLILKWVAPTFVNGNPNTVNINVVENENLEIK
jgi:hypothetical protein